MVNCLCVSACGKTFASSRKLCYHEKMCKTCGFMVKYRCEKCCKLFSTVKCLKQHQLVHSDVRKFKCHICDKSFKRKDHLNKHELSHSKERKFKCGICEKAFTQSGNRNIHVDNHFGVKSYRCMKCDKGFAQYSNARCHEETCRKTSTTVNPTVHSSTLNLSCQVSVGYQNISIECCNT